SALAMRGLEENTNNKATPKNINRSMDRQPRPSPGPGQPPKATKMTPGRRIAPPRFRRSCLLATPKFAANVGFEATRSVFSRRGHVTLQVHQIDRETARDVEDALVSVEFAIHDASDPRVRDLLEAAPARA